jgi:hypothetical protein
VCFFISGIVDSVAFAAWGCFANMQTGIFFQLSTVNTNAWMVSSTIQPGPDTVVTGNTIFVGLGASGQPTYPDFSWAKSLTAIGGFMLGTLFFSHSSRILKPFRRITLLGSFVAQTLCLIAAAAIVQSGIVATEPDRGADKIQWIQLLPLSLLSFQAAGQVVAAKYLTGGEIPTVVVTTLLCDLMSDVNLLAPLTENPSRNRRVIGYVALLVGAIIGGWMERTSGMVSALWLATGLKMLLTLGWGVWREKKQLGAGG